MDRKRIDRLYDALRFIGDNNFDVAISVLQEAIGEAVSHNREGLIKRSNSFLNGAIKTLQEVPEFEPPMVNMLIPEEQKRWNEFLRKVDEKKDIASRCVRTVIETEGGRSFLEGKHGRLMREGLPSDNQDVLDGIDALKAMISQGYSAPGEPAAGDVAADRQRGRKVKLPKDVFEREIFPILDKEFPSGGDNTGIIKRCEEIGKQYNVSGSTIKAKLYDMQGKKQGNKSR